MPGIWTGFGLGLEFGPDSRLFQKQPETVGGHTHGLTCVESLSQLRGQKVALALEVTQGRFHRDKLGNQLLCFGLDQSFCFLDAEFYRFDLTLKTLVDGFHASGDRVKHFANDLVQLRCKASSDRQVGLIATGNLATAECDS